MFLVSTSVTGHFANVCAWTYQYILYLGQKGKLEYGMNNGPILIFMLYLHIGTPLRNPSTLVPIATQSLRITQIFYWTFFNHKLHLYHILSVKLIKKSQICYWTDPVFTGFVCQSYVFHRDWLTWSSLKTRWQRSTLENISRLHTLWNRGSNASVTTHTGLFV